MYNQIPPESENNNQTGGNDSNNQTNETPECEVNSDCQEGYECIDGSCKEIVIPEPTCDKICPRPKYCIEGTCQFKDCEHDCQCAWDESCHGHHCQIVECNHGIVINHECIKW
jgi:hypothetical protein